MSVNFIKQGKRTSPAAIDAVEKQLGLEFPKDFRDFLLQSNGGRLEDNEFDVPRIGTGAGGIVEFFGIRPGHRIEDLSSEFTRMEARVPKGFVPVADAEGGNVICICAKGRDSGAVFYWDHELEPSEGKKPTRRNLFKVADNFSQFWEMLLPSQVESIALEPGEEAWVDPEFLKELENQ